MEHIFWSLVNGKVHYFMNSLKKAINTNILLRKIRYSPFFILQTCVFSFHSEYKSNTIPAMGVHWAVTPLHRNIFPRRVTSFITILIFVSFQTHCLLIFIFIHIGGIGGSHFSFWYVKWPTPPLNGQKNTTPRRSLLYFAFLWPWWQSPIFFSALPQAAQVFFFLLAVFDPWVQRKLESKIRFNNNSNNNYHHHLDKIHAVYRTDVGKDFRKKIK